MASNLAILSASTHLSTKEPQVSLLDKFDGNCSKFQALVNLVQLIFRLQPQRYPTTEAQVGFIGTLLSRVALSWFSLLSKKNSSILANLDNFLAEFNNTFGNIDKMQTATTKL